MTDERFSSDAHRYLDGELVDLITDDERALADRLNEAVASYARGLEVPGPEVDQAVMAVIRSPARRRSFWRWFVASHVVMVRPALAAAAVIAIIAFSSLVSMRTFLGSESAREIATSGESLRTVLVRFEVRAPGVQRVTLVGSFNDWDATAIGLTENRATGVWTVTVPLAPGEYQYLFVLDDDRWIPDPTAHAQVDDGFGQRNSVIAVGPRGVVRS